MIRILFQGDSITDGARGRTPDPNHIMGHGFVFSLASRLGYQYPCRFEFINKGEGGDTSEKLLARWQTEAVDLKPDIVNLLIGTNDFGHDCPVDGYEANLKKMVAALPRTTQMILCEPFRFQGDLSAEEWERKQPVMRQIQQIVRQVAAETPNSFFLPLQERFEAMQKLAPLSYWIWDGTHPTAQGHEVIVQAWLELMLPKLKATL